ncbi:32077_t:CDS:2 [Racocetra persica]|uniref:32077_t:CDS:1 n=1 Tax=Racocetra persica TaxID=160502 RepID=A0ACA9KII3_9GLOM|nr:32077_t:CDS:2 [Racocetra persica]
MTASRGLFGGAIVADIPSRFSDVSEIREVADNQEVFADINSDQSIIIEILQYVNEPSNEDAISLDTPKCLLIGQQQVTKFNERDPSSRNLLTIFMALFRFPNIMTDIVVTSNIPVAIGATSSSRLVAREGNANEGYEEFRRILASFEIRDWGLFNA